MGNKYYLTEGSHRMKDGAILEPGDTSAEVDENLITLFPDRFVSEAAGIIIDSDKVAADLAKMHTENGTVTPTVNAGDDATIQLPANADLDATVTDADGTDDLVYKWTKVSGPGDVTFTDDSIVDAEAAFSVDGVYVLKLTVTDDSSEASDTVTITVDPAA